MVTRAEVKRRGQVGLLPAEQEAIRLQRAALAAAQAFGAATLLDAQEIIGTAMPSLVTTISVSAPFDSPTGGSPQTTATRILTVPAGNPGRVRCDVAASSTDPTSQLNGGIFLGCGDETVLDVNDTNTLAFRLAGGASRSASITLYDVTTGARIDGPFVLTNT